MVVDVGVGVVVVMVLVAIAVTVTVIKATMSNVVTSAAPACRLAMC